MSIALGARLQAAISTWGPDVRLEARLDGGNRGRVWAVAVAGRRYVARQSRRSEPALAWEIELLDYLHAAGMLVPTSLPAEDGRRQVDGVVVHDWLDGDPPRSEADWRLVAAELERLHDLTRDWPRRPGFRSTRELLVADAGGDVRLDLMPKDAVARIRHAWQAIGDEPTSVVHGDPGPSNVRIQRGLVGFLDWDEARVDASLLDLAAIPLDLSATVGAERLARARRAVDAWEAANGWLIEPAYARRRLALLEAMERPTAPIAPTTPGKGEALDE